MTKRETRWERALIGAGAVALSAWFADQLLQWRYRSTEKADQLHYTTTSDGTKIGLWRHLPANTGSGEPVLLVHGLGVNHHHMDLDKQFSIARYLSNQGYDAWCVVLRGRGVSEVPNHSWNFDDYAKRDLPAAIDFILEQTGYSKLHWVGHSMGGMLYYAVAGAVNYQDKMASAVSAGGPFHGRRTGAGPRAPTNYPFPTTSGYTTLFAPFLELLRRLRLPWPVTARWTSVAYSGLKSFVPRELMHIMANPDNIADSTVRKAAVRDVERVEAGVLAQFLDWGFNRHWTDQSGKLNYRREVGSISVPTLLIAGSADNMVPVHNKQAGFEELASDDKQLVVAGKEDNFDADYSHVDMIYGHKAREEIFPLILDWLDSHQIRSEETTAVGRT